VNQSCIFRVVQVIKSLQDPLELQNNLPGINDNVMERGLEHKCFRRRRKVDREVDIRLFQMVGPAADSRQFQGRYQQTIGPSRAAGTPTRQFGDTNH